mgnify:CR=1 FL=1
MENIIKVENLCFEYEPGLKTIHNISFQIKKGEYVAILGHNGSGKSTIAKLLIGLLEKKSGNIVIDHKELNLENLYKIREKIGIVFQNPDNQFIGATVRDDIAFGLENICIPREKMDELIERYAKRVRMDQFLDHEPTKLSGGQKQRVAVARALTMDPKILLCDEATSALDPKTTNSILDLLMEINQKLGITVIIVTHQMEVVKEICNKVAFLKHGKMIATGKPEELFVAPNKDVQEFVGDSVEFLPKDGVNVRLFFNDETASDSAITHLAHELGINFGICQGKLENFRGTIMGSLVINVTEADRERVTAWLTDRGILWEVLENV